MYTYMYMYVEMGYGHGMDGTLSQRHSVFITHHKFLNYLGSIRVTLLKSFIVQFTQFWWGLCPETTKSEVGVCVCVCVFDKGMTFDQKVTQNVQQSHSVVRIDCPSQGDGDERKSLFHMMRTKWTRGKIRSKYILLVGGSKNESSYHVLDLSNCSTAGC